ncbi:MAG: ATP-binding protein [Bacteroidales bacterium]|nr:ATP-binding protein [Bacteroidales bacterium]
MKDILRIVIKEQQRQQVTSSEIDRGMPQELVDSQEILVISGIRRCGKSVLLQQIRKKQKDQDFFLNFDDERLIKFQVDDFQLLHEVFIELFGEQRTFYFDEIQNIAGWERFVRRLYDSGYKVFITGSNATMLSRELGTHLTGRYVRYELYPFSFQEFIAFRQKELPADQIFDTAERGAIISLFQDYLTMGGIPLYLKTSQDIYLKQLYESILYKDVLVRNKITNEKELLQLVYFLASNATKLSTNKSLSNVIGVKNPTTVRNYLEFVENTYLLFQISKFDFSLKVQLANPKKTYFIDNALILKLGFNFSENRGRLLENLVFIELKRRGNEIFYHQGKGECDFVIRNGIAVSQAIQVCAAFESETTKQREINGLMDAMVTYNLSKGIILTIETEEIVTLENKQIEIIPVWKWLLVSKNS